MKLLLQRAKSGRVDIASTTIAEINNGLVVLVGFGAGDTLTLPTQPIWQTMLRKMLELRIFSDNGGKMNLSVLDIGGEILLVPQFTLYADTRKGRRPSYTDACPPAIASMLFDAFINATRIAMPSPASVQCGQFGADMDITLTNWGPVTITLADTEYIR